MARANLSLTSKLVRQLKCVTDLVFLPSMLMRRRTLDANNDWPALIADICQKGPKQRIFANQDPAEISALCEVVKSLQPKVVVEIGTSCGGTMYLWSRIVQRGGLVVSIDLPGEPGSVRPMMRAVYSTFGTKFGVKSVMIDGDSHSSQTVNRLKTVLAGQSIDFLFIDGDHSYSGVRADFETYRSLVSPTGLIAMHDISSVPGHASIEVPRFWNELETISFDRKIKEFVAVRGKTPGIGVVRKVA